MKNFLKLIKNISKKKIFWIVLLLLLTVPTYSGLIRKGFFPMHDDLQAFRVYEMNKCFTDFQVPCRWVPDAGYQYGYPQFNYYPPLPYYIGELLHLTGFQYIDTVKILFALGFIFSAMAMFLLVGDLLGNFPAFVSAIIYSYVPYKAVDVYVRGALSEFWALVFYPLVFWAVYKLIKTPKVKYIALLALSLGGLLTTHLLMSMIFAVPAVIWTFSWLVQEKKFRMIREVVIGVLLGVGIASFFILPVIFEGKYAHTETMTMGYFGYLQHFVNVKKLFLSMEWGYGSSGFPNEKLNLSTGIVHWAFGLISICLGSYYVFSKKKDRNKKNMGWLVLTLGATELFTLFMIHAKSTFIWKMFPILSWLQFPWRFLTISIFLLAIIAGLGVYLLPKHKVPIGIAVVIFAVAINIGYFKPKDWLVITDADKFSGESWKKQLTISIFDYLPIYAKLPPITQAPDTPEILEGSALFPIYTKGSDWQKGTIEVKTESALIRLPLFDFPGMVVKIDGKKVPHVNNDCRNEEFCLGLITFPVSAGVHRIEVELTDTPIRRIGNYLSVFSFAAAVGILAIKKRSEKNI